MRSRFVARLMLCCAFSLAPGLGLWPAAFARDAKKTRLSATPGRFVIEATGEAPALSDEPVEPWKYRPERDEASREAAKALLETLSDPYTVLGLPESSLDPTQGGLLPLQRGEESTQRAGFDQ